MELEKQNILFLTRTMKLGGTENVILQLCEIFQPRVNKIIVCSCGGVNVIKLDAMGIKHYTIPDIAKKRVFDILRTIKIIKDIVKEENITIIHSHHRMAAFYAWISCRKKIIRIANAHNTFQDKKRLTTLAYSGTRIIAVGEKVKRNLTEFYNIPESQVTVIHNAVKPFEANIEPIAEFVDARSNGNLVVGNVGRLSVQKGMEYFIKAAAKVLENYPKVRFFIIGDGEDSEKLKNMAIELIPAGVVNFLDYRSDIQNVMCQLDFVVLSSLWEGFPLTPIEAFSVGKTIVATAVDGTPEIVVDGENGLLVESKDVVALSEGILKLCRNSVLRERLEKEALITYKSHFSFEKLSDQYLDYYTHLL